MFEDANANRWHTDGAVLPVYSSPADIPGAEDDEVEPFEDWLKHHMQAAGDKPEATFVALAGPEVVGWAKFSLTDAMPTTAHSATSW